MKPEYTEANTLLYTSLPTHFLTLLPSFSHATMAASLLSSIPSLVLNFPISALSSTPWPQFTSIISRLTDRIPRIARPGVSAIPINPVPEPGDEVRVMVTASLRSSNSTGGGCGVFYIKQRRLQIVVLAAMSAALVDLLEFNLYTNESCCYELNLELGS
nr:hypothetical protein Iba_chr06fCG5890 [Ipomoea batatas]GME16126.1 hypothetical protein Iba_scaffold17097CG0120 [Ipomoea batatas]